MACLQSVLVAAVMSTNGQRSEAEFTPDAYSLDDLVMDSLENERLIEVGLRREALKDRLSRDFAMTPAWPSTVAAGSDDHAILWIRNEDWLEALDEQRIVQALRSPRPSPHPVGVTYDIPLSDHPLVDVYIDHFANRGRKFFAKWLARAERYRPIMTPILDHYGLPRDTFYLAMIESGLNARAYSVSAASGFWQFIRSTAEIFNMRMDHWVDERRDFITATHAACRYLSELHRQFKGDWYLAWASYNAGAGRVTRALKRSRSSSYWQLVDRKALPEETRQYVAKIIAAAIVAKNADIYGFSPIQAETPLDYDELDVHRAIDLRRLARALDIEVDTLRALNPSLLRDTTPPKRKSTLRVPRGSVEQASAWIAEQPAMKLARLRPYRIRRGDTLTSVARRFGVSIASLKDFNTIASIHDLSVGQRLLVPVRQTQRRSPSGERAQSQRTIVASSREKRHVVARGETLWSISQRYGCNVKQLKHWNRLRGPKIREGQVLTVRH